MTSGPTEEKSLAELVKQLSQQSSELASWPAS